MAGTAKVEFYEALVHPALLIHPNPYRVVTIHDVSGQILQQVLQHDLVQEVICLIPTSFKNTSLWTDTSDPRISIVYIDDPIPYFQQSLRPIDVIFVDAVMYVSAEWFVVSSSSSHISAVRNRNFIHGFLLCCLSNQYIPNIR